MNPDLGIKQIATEIRGGYTDLDGTGDIIMLDRTKGASVV